MDEVRNNNVIPILEDGKYDSGWLDILDSIPDDINLLEQSLRGLINIDKSNLNQIELHNLLFKHIVVLVNHAEIFDPETINKSEIWRARKNIDEANEDITNQKSFSYPPNCIKNGRCHLKDQPVFYASWNKATAIFETRPQIGDIVFVSRWKCWCDRKINLRFLLPRNIPESSTFFTYSQKQAKLFKSTSDRYGRNKSEQLQMIARFIGEYFLEEEYPYYMTSYLGNKILFDKNNLDLFYYPSAFNKYTSLNMAIKPSFVDSYFSIDKVYAIQVESLIEKRVNFYPLNIAEPLNGKLVWREIEDTDIQFLK